MVVVAVVVVVVVVLMVVVVVAAAVVAAVTHCCVTDVYVPISSVPSPDTAAPFLTSPLVPAANHWWLK